VLKFACSIALVFAVVGCQTAKQPEPLVPLTPVTEITPTPSSPGNIATPADPANDVTVTATPTTPTNPTAPAPKKTYMVKRGDTLWSIAKATYGDGKQYTKIAAANPGVAPQALKVGQTIVLP
jgi:5'-nucleotidase